MFVAVSNSVCVDVSNDYVIFSVFHYMAYPPNFHVREAPDYVIGVSMTNLS